jgi:beta-glucanase (GH16 family)
MILKKTVLIIGLLISPACVRGADLVIQSPRDYEVFQRDSLTAGAVRLHGKGNAEADVWQYRLIQKPKAGEGRVDPWRDFPSALQKDRFDFFVSAPTGGWYQLEIRGLKAGDVIASGFVDHVGVGEVFLIAGQSNAGNHGSERQLSESGLVSSFDGKKWNIANDPQKGASGSGGSFLPSFGDKVAQRFNVPVGLVPMAAGGTSVREWLPEGTPFQQQTTTGKGVRKNDNGLWESDGILFNALTSKLEERGSHGVRAVLWHQGESDAGQARSGYPADRQISGEQYTQFLTTLVTSARSKAGWSVPWFTAQTTYHSEVDASDSEFREAQSRMWKNGTTLQGPDTDALRAEFRQGVHFNAAGLQKHGELWAQQVSSWLEAELTAPRRAGPPSSDYKLVWSDEFDGKELDKTKWKHRYPGVRKDGVNDPSSTSLDGEGHLSITCSRQEGKVYVDMICTDGLFEARYGYFEARVQFQTQEGWWPGFWLMANTVASPDKGLGAVDDTSRNGTEVDIFEYLRIRGDQIQHALHWNGYGPAHKSIGHHPNIPGLTSGFHTVGCEWTPEQYIFYVDGKKTFETRQSVSQVPEYVILSGEVSSWPGDISRAKLPDKVVFDYVRVWQKK